MPVPIPHDGQIIPRWRQIEQGTYLALLLVLLCVLLPGCATIDAYKERQQRLLSPAPLNSPAAKSAISGSYTALMTAAQNDPTAIPLWIDAGSAVNSIHCGDWLEGVADNSRNQAVGSGNAAVIENAVTAVLGLARASSSTVAAWGIGATAYEGFKDVQLRALSAPAAYQVQATLRGMLGSCSDQLRADARTLSWAQAFVRLEACSRVCSYEAAAAAATNSLATTVTVVNPVSGALTTTAVTSSAVKDDAGARLLGYWRPGGVVDRAAEARIRAWMAANGIESSITMLANSALYASARAKAVADLGIPEVPK